MLSGHRFKLEMLGAALRAAARGRARALSGSAGEVYEVQRLYVSEEVFATHGPTIRTALQDLLVKVSNCPAKVDVQALWTRPLGGGGSSAVNPSRGEPIEIPHPSSMGGLENIASWVARYHDYSHLAQAWDIAARNEHVRASLARVPLSELLRIERIPMLRVPSVATNPNVELHAGKIYEVRAYTLKDYQPPSAADGLLANAEASAYSDWLAAKVGPLLAARGGRIVGFWMRCDGLAQLTSSAALVGAAAAPALNTADPVPDVFWVAEWDNQAQAAQTYAAQTVATFDGNPYARDGAPHRYERIEVTWSDAMAMRSLVNSGVVGLSYDSGHFHSPKRR
jgi:hypothetical protein